MSRHSLALWRAGASATAYRPCYLYSTSGFLRRRIASACLSSTRTSLTLLRAGRPSLVQTSAPFVRLYVNDTRKPQKDETKDQQKPVLLQQTAELGKKISARIAQNLRHENIYTVPNILTFSRLLATPAIGYLILHDANAWAVGLLFYAGVTDLLDGWIARRWNLQTVVGTVIDPLADKALMTILTVCLAVKGALPIWLATLILGRDISLAIAAIYYRYASLPAPKSFARYWDFSLPSAEVHPTGLSKANTFLQLLLIGAATAMPIVQPAVDAFMQNVGQGGIGASGLMTGAQYLVAATTAWSGASYLWTRNAVKILGDGTDAAKKRILIKGRMVLGTSFASCFALALVLEQLYA